MQSIAALIMAAGSSARFGQCKQLTRVGNKPLLQHSIDLAQAICPGNVFAVSGAWHEKLTKAMNHQEIKNVSLIYHPEWSEGLSSSIARGVNEVSSRVDSILIMLADQIALTSEDLVQLHNQFTGNNIVCGFYASRRGVPAIFGRNSFKNLTELHGDHGAKALLYDPHVPVVEYALEHAMIDIDTPEDLHIWNTNKDNDYALEGQRNCV